VLVENGRSNDGPGEKQAIVANARTQRSNTLSGNEVTHNDCPDMIVSSQLWLELTDGHWKVVWSNESAYEPIVRELLWIIAIILVVGRQTAKTSKRLGAIMTH
jgi:hypothetical protein